MIPHRRYESFVDFQHVAHAANMQKSSLQEHRVKEANSNANPPMPKAGCLLYTMFSGGITLVREVGKRDLCVYPMFCGGTGAFLN